MPTPQLSPAQEYTSEEVWTLLGINRRFFYRYLRPYVKCCRINGRQQFFSGKSINGYTKTTTFKRRWEGRYAQ